MYTGSIHGYVYWEYTVLCILGVYMAMYTGSIQYYVYSNDCLEYEVNVF